MTNGRMNVTALHRPDDERYTTSDHWVARDWMGDLLLILLITVHRWKGTARTGTNRCARYYYIQGQLGLT